MGFLLEFLMFAFALWDVGLSALRQGMLFYFVSFTLIVGV